MHEWSFRPSVYAGALPGAAAWNVPPLLRETKTLWALYECNDLLSIARQTIFRACLVTLESEAGDGRVYESVEAFARNYAAAPALEGELSALEAENLRRSGRSNKAVGPSDCEFEDPQHEFQLEMQLHDGWDRTEDLQSLSKTGNLGWARLIGNGYSRFRGTCTDRIVRGEPQ
jgi:hypothetical protein